VAQAKHDVAEDETTGSLTAKLAERGTELLLEILPGWLRGEVKPQPQDGSLATYCEQLRREDGLLDWNQPAEYIDRQIRAFDPWPGTYTTLDGLRLKVLRARPQPRWQGEEVPGRVVAPTGGLAAATGQGLLHLEEVQLAGRKPMAGEAFMRGQRDLEGRILGT
jgi:methionyl-tRNA formyltransferase